MLDRNKNTLNLFSWLFKPKINTLYLVRVLIFFKIIFVLGGSRSNTLYLPVAVAQPAVGCSECCLNNLFI